MAPYSSRHSVPLGGNRHAFGGAGLNLDVSALGGETEMVTAFEDFNQHTALASVGANVPLAGWLSSDVGGLVGLSGINPTNVGVGSPSSLVLQSGATADAGINIQIANDSEASPFIHYPDDVFDTAMDGRAFSFACRIGLSSNIGTSWIHKAFIGFAGNPDASIMTVGSGDLTVASRNGLLGFHIAEDGHIDFVSQRNTGVALVSDTNFTQLFPAGSVDYTAAETVVWFDLAFRLNVVNLSDAANNGTAQAFVRRVPLPGGPFETAGTQSQARERLVSDGNQAPDAPWTPAGVVLLNQNPNPSTALGELVPTVELLSGVTGAGNTAQMYVDWWAMGISRASRRTADIP